jgi:ELWxxDGT repeat protein
MKMMPIQFSRSSSLILVTAICAFASDRTCFAQTTPVVQLIKDINRGQISSDPAGFVTLNGIAYFRANDGTHGFELWRSDGTEGGTQLVSDLNPGLPNGFPDNLTVANGSLYFTAFDDPGYIGSKVWRSDGSPSGTILLADTYPGLVGGGIFGPPLPRNFTALNPNTVVFAALDPVAGLEPWKTDGTPPGTNRIVDLHPGPEWSVPIEFTRLHNVAYFAADDSALYRAGTVTFNREPFRTDGTAQGTYRVKDIYPGFNPSIPTDFIRYQQQVFFRASDPAHGFELWRTDGTWAGTNLVADLNPGRFSSFLQDPITAKFTSAGETKTVLVFLADDGRHGLELFRSDGTEAGTRLIKDINPTGDSFPQGMTSFNGRVYFSADDGVHGTEPWVTDGTAVGTHLLADLNAGSLRSSPQSFRVVGDKLFFVAIVPDDAHYTVQTQLWITDGTSAGTKLIYQEPGVSYGYSINELTALGNKLLFTAPKSADADGFSRDIELFSALIE